MRLHSFENSGFAITPTADNGHILVCEDDARGASMQKSDGEIPFWVAVSWVRARSIEPAKVSAARAGDIGAVIVAGENEGDWSLETGFCTGLTADGRRIQFNQFTEVIPIAATPTVEA